ncbi:YpzG family protein [Halobacillus litoralis]|uniref:YpzG family protein n=2 Tax=Halobacillus TaxID=45667 RepID=A0A845DUM6_9BACI|nr:YpzG family protein [Halobacillus litoralis]MYL30352.1 YpzG family protein [Halobacillus halophilus]MYL38345.1 YpzG family protein [Halobacillus litoralis]
MIRVNTQTNVRMERSTISRRNARPDRDTAMSTTQGGITMGKRNFKAAPASHSHRSSKHMSRRVNGETEQTQANQITEIQMRKRN